MTYDLTKFTNLYFDSKNHRFSISQVNNSLEFVHWYELKKLNIRSLSKGDTFRAYARKYNLEGISRGYSLESLVSLNSNGNLGAEIIENEEINEGKLIKIITNKHISPIIFINCRFSEIEIEHHTFNREIGFIECSFLSNMRMISCDFIKNLWFPNCRFMKHFSLKNSVIKGSIHMEACNFSGAGGVSLRGVNCRSIYFDLGVIGGDDLVWLNEMTVSETLSIGGIFNNEIQILANQDSDVKCTSSIENIYIGSEIYNYEKANSTSINDKVTIDGICIEKLEINELDVNGLNIRESEVRLLSIDNTNISNVLSIESNMIGEQAPSPDSIALAVTNCSIGRHFKIEKNDVFGKASFFSTAVSDVTYLENNTLSDKTTINLIKFTSSRFLISPLSSLYSSERPHIFRPKKFKIIDEYNSELAAEQYCSLKHWLSDSGHLDHEDEAFYFMRHYFTSSKIKRFIFGTIFGWGVRLTNIAISSILTILFYSFIYYCIEPKIKAFSPLSLSFQSFLGSFFGKWLDFEPDGLLASIVTLETATGVLLITVFIGAYIRKLLR
ncbi:MULTISPECIES: hypothetical protein [Pseudoalteromonas]|uniref:hypothetical protein n=1 Tax=Pseudoalteromonas TaxID=53246 RepID=UPI00158288A3|nr:MULTISPECIES: hypothetical protein [Pseudoalteromonas]MDI4654293.1 hypothetical protein [Pseudoalteromonas shioyasakiensis]NUJ40644.1 hypothetical protein [Pseudoalteromonas sp. 0303]